MSANKMASCIFCKIIKGMLPHPSPRLSLSFTSTSAIRTVPDTSTGDIPSFKLYESEKVLAFLDIQPLSKGHALVIPKAHGAKLTDIPDDQLAEILPVVKKLLLATGASDYNVLQNNGRIAHQEVDHVCSSYDCCSSGPGSWDDDGALGLGQCHGQICCGDEDYEHWLTEIQVHFHVIPKPNVEEGLTVGWPQQKTDMDKLKDLFAEIKGKM